MGDKMAQIACVAAKDTGCQVLSFMVNLASLIQETSSVVCTVQIHGSATLSDPAASAVVCCSHLQRLQKTHDCPKGTL